MFDNIGATEMVIIALVIIIFFGGSKLKEVAKGLGESSLEVKKAKKEFEQAVTEIKLPPEDLPLNAPEKIARKSTHKRKKGGSLNV